MCVHGSGQAQCTLQGNLARRAAEKVGAVRTAVRQRLIASNVTYGFGSAARGSDLIFLEELLSLGGRARVYLPFPRQDFARTSVGYGWDDRYYTVLNHDKVEVIELSTQVPPSDDRRNAAYQDCNAKILEAAQSQAKLLNQKPILFAVWNGTPGDGKGGTADAVRAWQAKGYEVQLIDISKL